MSTIGKNTREAILDRDGEENTLRLKTTSETRPTVAVGASHKTNLKHNKKKSGDNKHLNSSDSSNSKQKGKSKLKKCFVRNPEVPLSNGPTPIICKGILKNPLARIEREVESKKDVPETYFNVNSKYSTPELYSSLSIAKKISTAKQEKIKPSAEASGASKQIMDDKVANSLNFPLEEQVYRDLIALNVSDSDLLKETEKEKHASKEFESTRKDQEPQLDNFFQPEQGKEYSSVSIPLPCEVDKVRRYNGHSIYNRTQLWESSALEQI